jgi:hypothetical protein
LLDGQPRRTPWISMDDVKQKGAVVVWGMTTGSSQTKVWGGFELNAVPFDYAAAATDAAVQPTFDIPFYGEEVTLRVGWAIVAPGN